MSDPSTLSVKELKAAIVSFIGEAGLKSKNFLEKQQLVDFLVEQQALELAKTKGIFTVASGKYILGDPCFAAVDLLDLEMFNDTYYEKESDEESGDRKKNKAKKQEKQIPRFNADTVVTAFNTYNADRGPMWFTDSSKEFSFLINSGVVALVPLSYNARFEEESGSGKITEAHIVEFDAPAQCYAKAGVLHFGHIVINTRKMGVSDGDGSVGKSKRRKLGRMDRYEDEDEVDEVESEVESEEEEEWSR